MHIVAGKWARAQLELPKSDIRPTLARTREAIASSILAHFGNDLSRLTVLDAFAGSGSVGLELLSRGALSAYFAEKNRQTYRVLEKNTESLIRRTDSSNGTIAQAYFGDIITALTDPQFLGTTQLDIVFLDPPYELDPDLSAQVIIRLSKANHLSDNALIIHERAQSADAIPAQDLALKLLKEKRYASSVIAYYTR